MSRTTTSDNIADVQRLSLALGEAVTRLAMRCHELETENQQLRQRLEIAQGACRGAGVIR